METAFGFVTVYLSVYLLLCQFSGGSADCPTGWIESESNCFKVFNADDNRKRSLNWHGSSEYCRKMNANLASFSSLDQEILIFRVAKVARFEVVWIGLNDIDTEGNYVWSDGSNVNYTNWGGMRLGYQSYITDCVASQSLLRMGRALEVTMWRLRPCNSNVRSWMCKISSGKELITQSPPPTPDYCYENNTVWLKYGDSMCYFFSSSTVIEPKTWTESRKYCYSKGAELLSLHDANETAWIASRLQLEERRPWWIGLRQYGFGGKYEWSDGTALDYVNWLESEPNNLNGEEECAQISGSSDTAQWNDQHCADEFSFICKKFIHNVDPITHPPTTPIPGLCPTGWVEFDDKCYRFYGVDDASERHNWSAARDVCRSLRSNLATVHTREIQNFLYSQLYSAKSPVWIGLSNAANRRKYRWTDGTTLTYTNWGKNQPLIYRASCVEVKEERGEWNGEYCRSKRAWLCQGDKDVQPQPENPTRPDDKACIAGYTYYNGGCYKVYKNPQTFQQASMQCRKDGGNLASLMNAFEEAYVETLVHIQGSSLLIGMELNEQTGEYEWSDGSPMFYTSWNSVPVGEDAGSGAYTNSCVKATKDGWETRNCDDLLGAICKIYLVPPPTTPEHIEGHCGNEVAWVPYGSDCYFFGHKDHKLPASQAQFNCMQWDSTLVTIHHYQENEFILSQLDSNQDIWIGLVKGHGGFRWVDNSPLQFTRWAAGQPNLASRSFGEEDCVTLQRYNGGWDDVRCFSRKGYVCKKPKIVPTSLSITAIKEIQENSTDVKPVTIKRVIGRAEDSQGIGVPSIILITEAVIVVVVVIPMVAWRIHKRQHKYAVYKRNRVMDDTSVGNRFENHLQPDNISSEQIRAPPTEQARDSGTERQGTMVVTTC
ncbi:macrophage mannose receptor 1-like isoform X2 [Ptychodera flava]|uniref:macrophage mannose receptor 1-like isoform X2 n=1 Tax=Ptychodera flava TaxID=63121 RepID=UPI00396A7449